MLLQVVFSFLNQLVQVRRLKIQNLHKERIDSKLGRESNYTRIPDDDRRLYDSNDYNII